MLGYGANVAPMRIDRYADCKILGLLIGVFCATFGHIATILLIIYIADALKEQQREDVFFVTGGVNLAT